jgi:tripartite-type tricarboxylate transporter receptor subunit TctC
VIADHGVSGVSTRLCERPEGKRLFDLLRRGDVLVVRWVDRLGRNYDDVVETIRKFIRDIEPVAGIARGTSLMEVNLSFPAQTISEFIAYAKSNPGKINMGAVGVGSATHMYGELFKLMAHLDLVTVNYRTPALALSDLIGGQINVMFDSLVSSIEHVRAPELRALAVTSATRLEALPDIPPVGDFVPGYEAASWYGIGAPRNTPPNIIDELNKEINAALADPKMKSRIADLGGLPMPMTSTDLVKFIAGETEKWGKVVRAANIKPE